MNIEWNDSMSTGVTEIDEQHQELIAAFNSLAQAMEEGKGGDEIEKILAFVMEYARKHFRAEEKYFEQYDCPACTENQQQHTIFLERFIGLMKEFHEKGAHLKLLLKIHKELSDWLIQHIFEIDIQLRPCATRG